MLYGFNDGDFNAGAACPTHESVLARLSEEERAAAVAEELRTRGQRFDDYGFHSLIDLF